MCGGSWATEQFHFCIPPSTLTSTLTSTHPSHPPHTPPYQVPKDEDCDTWVSIISAAASGDEVDDAVGPLLV